MLQLIIFLIFTVSVLGMAIILFMKIPALVQLPQHGHSGIGKSRLVLHVGGKLKKFHFDFFYKQVFLHKVLSLVKVWILKLETKIDTLLHGIRKKAQQIDKEVKAKKK